MKATGMVRKVDGLGRISIPIELRRKLKINFKDDLEILVDAEKVVLRKYKPSCLFCSNTNNIKPIDNRSVCQECIGKLVNQ